MVLVAGTALGLALGVSQASPPIHPPVHPLAASALLTRTDASRLLKEPIEAAATPPAQSKYLCGYSRDVG